MISNCQILFHVVPSSDWLWSSYCRLRSVGYRIFTGADHKPSLNFVYGIYPSTAINFQYYSPSTIVHISYHGWILSQRASISFLSSFSRLYPTTCIHVEYPLLGRVSNLTGRLNRVARQLIYHIVTVYGVMYGRYWDDRSNRHPAAVRGVLFSTEYRYSP